MARTIQQAVTLEASPDELFDIYVDSKKHSAATGGKATIGRKVGTAYSAHDGYITGRTLAIVPGRMIVQSWRGSDWKESDLDSILILTFSTAAGGGRITLTHANLPDSQADGIKKGWTEYYWRPWKAYLKTR